MAAAPSAIARPGGLAQAAPGLFAVWGSASGCCAFLHVEGDQVESVRATVEKRNDLLVMVPVPSGSNFEAFERQLRPLFQTKPGQRPRPLADLAARLRWWSVGCNHDDGRAVAAIHRKRCIAGRGFLNNRRTGEQKPTSCKSWRECEYCARQYALAVAERWRPVRGLRAFVVFTMPPEQGDWRNRENIKAMMRAWRRLRARLQRKFGRRFKLLWTKEHAGAEGRLHFNVLWDAPWVDQAWLSQAAGACGFGKVVDISRIGPGGRRYDNQALRGGAGNGREPANYALKSFYSPSKLSARLASAGEKVSAYARKELGRTAAAGDDWPKGTRRWGASRAARGEMPARPRNADWFWSRGPNFLPPGPDGVDGSPCAAGERKPDLRLCLGRRLQALPFDESARGP